ncbi:MAG: molecular chaperone HtpG [Gemmatimonadetes bacterium]|jgi:molecular chaperone HtpG|nr:molecular chaperone HtpG [Gemmatimonadota bacterium]MBT6149882.1 molecular chaperone HtpG [Gemmatimonadota bacterium]MBT7859405.1 molecular chaperone HtpG [Gemmatimonadota bacterium]
MTESKSTSAGEAQAEERTFQTEVQQILQILIHSLYTDKDVFLRELMSNASDALDKVRFQSLTDKSIVDPDAELEIEITVDAEAKTLTIRDTGIGMTRDEVNENIGTIAHSGSREFIQQLNEESNEENKLKLIGQFGVGFYSVFMIAERVEVTTRSANEEAEAVIWESTGDGAYTIASTKDKVDRGTQIKIFVRSDCEEYLDAHRLETVVRRHSDYVSYPIKVAGKQANAASALWARPRNELTAENYKEFYQHLTGDHQDPLAWEHTAVDVPIQFYSVVYIPQQSPMEILFAPEPKISLNLHVNRVFIQDDCNDLLPLYLRFIRGVVDCDDLPLNVARESLQNNPVIIKIRQTLTRRILNKIEELSKNDPAAYLTFWESFGIVLKEGVARDLENQEKVSQLLRFHSSFSNKLAADAKADSASTSAESETEGDTEGEAVEAPARTPEMEGLVSLQDYIDRATSDQEVIYYVSGENRPQVEQSPLMEAFRKRELEVLYLTDPVDEWVVNSLQKFDGKEFVAIDAEDLELPEEVKLEGIDSDSGEKERTIELVSYLKSQLSDRVGEVKESSRLTDSPCALVVPKGGVSQQMERLMRMSNEAFPLTKRTLEINPNHPAIANMGELLKADRDSDELKDWSQFLVDYVLLAEGKVEEPQRVMKQVQRMMSMASEAALKARTS